MEIAKGKMKTNLSTLSGGRRISTMAKGRLKAMGKYMEERWMDLGKVLEIYLSLIISIFQIHFLQLHDHLYMTYNRSSNSFMSGRLESVCQLMVWSLLLVPVCRKNSSPLLPISSSRSLNVYGRSGILNFWFASPIRSIRFALFDTTEYWLPLPWQYQSRQYYETAARC